MAWKNSSPVFHVSQGSIMTVSGFICAIKQAPVGKETSSSDFYEHPGKKLTIQEMMATVQKDDPVFHHLNVIRGKYLGRKNFGAACHTDRDK